MCSRKTLPMRPLVYKAKTDRSFERVNFLFKRVNFIRSLEERVNLNQNLEVLDIRYNDIDSHKRSTYIPYGEYQLKAYNLGVWASVREGPAGPARLALQCQSNGTWLEALPTAPRNLQLVLRRSPIVALGSLASHLQSSQYVGCSSSTWNMQWNPFVKNRCGPRSTNSL